MNANGSRFARAYGLPGPYKSPADCLPWERSPSEGSCSGGASGSGPVSGQQSGGGSSFCEKGLPSFLNEVDSLSFSPLSRPEGESGVERGVPIGGGSIGGGGPAGGGTVGGGVDGGGTGGSSGAPSRPCSVMRVSREYQL